MSAFQFSSDPHSGVNKLRYRLHVARERIRAANRGEGDRGAALGDFSRALSALRAQIHGKPKRRHADFEAIVDGIPCGVVVLSLSHGRAAILTGDPPEPEEPPEVEFELIDRRGYRAKWLERKLSDDEISDICAEALERDSDAHEQAIAERQGVAWF